MISEQSVTKKLIAMGAFLLLQFLLVAIIIIFTGFWIIKSHIDGIPFSDSTIQIFLTFIGAYITSVVVEFLLVAIIIIFTGFWIIKSHIDGIPFSDSTIQIFLTFIGAYITSVVVELIAILRYIVKNVFDTSISGMVNNFKDTKNT